MMKDSIHVQSNVYWWWRSLLGPSPANKNVPVLNLELTVNVEAIDPGMNLFKTPFLRASLSSWYIRIWVDFTSRSVPAKWFRGSVVSYHGSGSLRPVPAVRLLIY